MSPGMGDAPRSAGPDVTELTVASLICLRWALSRSLRLETPERTYAEPPRVSLVGAGEGERITSCRLPVVAASFGDVAAVDSPGLLRPRRSESGRKSALSGLWWCWCPIGDAFPRMPAEERETVLAWSTWWVPLEKKDELFSEPVAPLDGLSPKCEYLVITSMWLRPVS